MPACAKGSASPLPRRPRTSNVLKMSALDFVALGLASLIVALTMTREVRDLNIGAMMTMQAIERQRAAKKHDEDAETTTSGATEGGLASFAKMMKRQALLSLLRRRRKAGRTFSRTR